MPRLTRRTLTVARNVARVRWAVMLLSASGVLPSSSALPDVALRAVASGVARAKLRSLRHARPGTARFVVPAPIAASLGGLSEGRYVVASVPGRRGLRRISVCLRWQGRGHWNEVAVTDVTTALPQTYRAR